MFATFGIVNKLLPITKDKSCALLVSLAPSTVPLLLALVKTILITIFNAYFYHFPFKFGGRISFKLIPNHSLPSGLCFCQPVMFYNLGEALVVLCLVFVVLLLFFFYPYISQFSTLLFLSYIQEV
jgi:hypothetical protein